MKVVIGIPGTISGLLLRIGQCLFAGASIGVMVTALGFSNYTTFCYLIASMALQLMWSLGLSCVDIYALWNRRDLYTPILVSLFIVGDWVKIFWPHGYPCNYERTVTATLSFAGACSSAGVATLFARDVHFCTVNPQLPCGTYEISIALAFVAWLLIATSSLIMFALLAST